MKNMEQKSMVMTEDTITIFYNGKMYPPINKTHTNFEKIKDAIKSDDWQLIPDLIDITSKVSRYVASSNVTIESGILKYKGRELNNLLSNRTIQLMNDGFDIKHMVAFIENLHNNPSNRAVNELYSFLERISLPITEDGHFLAYKAVRNDYKDIYSGTFDNSVGKVVEIERNLVDEDKENHCSHGLHVGALKYVKQYGHFKDDEISDVGNKLLIVKVNPRDAVSVPVDHDCTKLRVCKYEVISEIDNLKDTLDTVVYTRDGEKLDSDWFDDVNYESDYDFDDDTENYHTDEDCEWSSDCSGDCQSCDCGNDGNDKNSDYDLGFLDGKYDKMAGFMYKSPNISNEYDLGYKSGYNY